MKRKTEEIKHLVRQGYAKAVFRKTSCCPGSSCGEATDRARTISKQIGYTDTEINTVPEGANLGFGCGNPVALASLREGDMVLDLGSGAGFDAFLAAQCVGKTGRVIGVDMTPEMIAKAKENAQKGNYTNVEFRLGEIEKLPVKDNTIDVIISNCVINLSPDKANVFKEAFRVLKPGGRLMVSDLVLVKDLPASVKESVEAYVGCLAGAIMKHLYLQHMRAAGFDKVRVESETNYPLTAMANDVTARAISGNPGIPKVDTAAVEEAVASIKVSALKPPAKGS